MRIRSIKPEFWQSEDIAVLPIEDRLLFIGLWSYVDDNGVGRDQPVSICTSLFAGDFVASPAETLARVAGGLQNLATHGRITRYTVGGASFIAVTNWKRHQKIDRPNKPRLPEADHPEAVLTTPNADAVRATGPKLASIAESLASDAETLPVRNRGTGEQGNRGTEEESSSSTNADASEDGRDDVDSLCSHLAQSIIRNGNKPPTVGTAWKRAARLMLDRDNRDEAEAHRLIDWCQADSFWMSNILSMPKFREKYDQLRLRAGAAVPAAAPSPADDDWEEPEEDRSIYEAYDAQMRALEEASA